ncbi:hypothetical protein PENDEC_c007G02536 [Penicillium decumbens]|uniref:Putative lipase ATG15 n=1 Tax=Penicillium decumbens TaxID=69771 RepID=A0A1V6PFR8_PENDC|nr:hypothetical protein PENDEC_c007G02536 [Penicillium decumbens]
MARSQRSRTRPGKRLRISDLLLSALSLPRAVYGHYDLPPLQAPILSPQLPFDGSEPSSETHEFSLRHIFHRGTYEHPDLHARLDIRPETRLLTLSEDGTETEFVEEYPSLVASSNPITIQRLADRRLSVIEGHLAAAKMSGAASVLSPTEWVMDTIPGPNISDKDTILTFAKMTANDYIEVPGTEDWRTIHGKFNYSTSFGWKGDGLRGHIYSDKSNSTIVISLKGTSPALFDGAGTTTNDKINDNLFFSCCCGQGGSYLWRQSCDCQTSTYKANLTCITEAMNDENKYYRAAIDLYSNVTEIYPNSNVWLTGHSLGGAMTSLLGLTFGLPVVTFEAVPEALPAARLGLPSPPGHDPRLPQRRGNTGAYHFGHTADPVYMGTCNGINSVCTWGGYAMESACHTGQMCTYDTVADKGWRVGIGTHKIRNVISDVIQVYDDQWFRNHYHDDYDDYISNPHQDRNLQDSRLVGLSRWDNYYYHYHHHLSHNYGNNYDMQNTGMVWLQGPNDHNDNRNLNCDVDLNVRDAGLVRLQRPDRHRASNNIGAHSDTHAHSSSGNFYNSPYRSWLEGLTYL